MDHQVIQGDCVEHLKTFTGKVNLLFADPPYNIGFKYDRYDDKRQYADYTAWTNQWIAASAAALTPSGSAFFMIGDEFAAETRLAVRAAGLTVRNWIVWSYTFGQHRPKKFGRSHVHIFYAVKDAKVHTFNEIALRVPSRRGMVYNDRRTDPRGRLPDDTWTCYPRVCGTFKARQDWHGCQLPEDLLARIITGSSNPGDLVLDPFVGSGTTLVVAKRFGRRGVGIELSTEYVQQAELRISSIADEEDKGLEGWPLHQVRELIRFYREASYPLSAFIKLATARDHFTGVFNRRVGANYPWTDVRRQLLTLKAEGVLPVIDPVEEADEEHPSLRLSQ
jgi:site-specific DNA-methyltransferase (adenine-specific)